MAAFSAEEIEDIIVEECEKSFVMSPAALAFLNREITFNPDLENASREEIVKWVKKIINDIPDSYATTSGEVEFDNLTITAWDLNDAIIDDEDNDIETSRLPVQFTINGTVLNYNLNMDDAMGTYLAAKVMGKDISMTMYGTPLTYFNEGESDVYLRYNDYATEDENCVQMIGSERKYFFHGYEFIQAIMTCIRCFNLNELDYITLYKSGEKVVIPVQPE